MKNTEEFQKIVKWIMKKNIDVNAIALKIETFDIKEREQLLFIAQNYSDNIAEKIIVANTIVEQKKLETFISLVDNGNYENFLTNLSLNEKVNLLEKLELFQSGTNKIKLYKDIIYSSIDDSIKYQRKK